MATRSNSRGLPGPENHNMEEGDPLSPRSTVQESLAMRDAVVWLRKWIRGENNFDHCVITGPTGSGRTHLLDALAGILSPEKTIRCFSAEPEWEAATRRIENGERNWILIDDFDRYDNQFRKQFFAAVKKRSFRISASLVNFDGRIERLWNDNLKRPYELRLSSLYGRPEDVAAFLPHWAERNGYRLPDNVSFMETLKLIEVMNLPRSFSDLECLLDKVMEIGANFWDPPEPAKWMDAYSRIVSEPRDTRPVILVEGETDAIYLQWVSELTRDSPVTDVTIEPCQSASRILEKAFAYRNEGRKAVALLDCDKPGREQHEQMKDHDLRSVPIPNRYDPLKECSQDHVHHVVEIEDLLPVADVERFLANTGHQPELVIHAPRILSKRIVVHSEDKRDLAKWVRANLGCRSAGCMLELYNELRRTLDLPLCAFPYHQAEGQAD